QSWVSSRDAPAVLPAATELDGAPRPGAPAPLSFAEVFQLVRAGEDIPGLEKPDIVLSSWVTHTLVCLCVRASACCAAKRSVCVCSGEKLNHRFVETCRETLSLAM
uniref:Peroxisomal membrane protein PEX14-like KPWE domain-containing protein n=1 Tax=Scleropages formosus TaxID=113540 RepID=A0A8C9WU81_SCLFO